MEEGEADMKGNPFSKDKVGGCSITKPGAKPSCAGGSKKEDEKVVYGLFREDCFATYVNKVDQSQDNKDF